MEWLNALLNVSIIFKQLEQQLENVNIIGLINFYFVYSTSTHNFVLSFFFLVTYTRVFFLNLKQFVVYILFANDNFVSVILF